MFNLQWNPTYKDTLGTESKCPLKQGVLKISEMGIYIFKQDNVPKGTGPTK